MEGIDDQDKSASFIASAPARRSTSSLGVMGEMSSPRLVSQRIRNRVFEYFQCVVDYRGDPGVWDLNELINSWEMNVNDPFLSSDYEPPAFAPAEVAAMAITHQAWLAFSDRTPKSIKDEAAAFALPEWDDLVAACAAAIKVFDRRGQLPEDKEIADEA